MAAGLTQLAHGAIVINEVDLAANRVEIINIGASTENISAWWWCNRVNGSPFYDQVDDVSTIIAGLSSPGATTSALGAGDVIVLDLAAGFLPDVNGELGLYNTNSFGSASAIVDYVLWGANGIRDTVAQIAGLWTDNDFVDISGIGAGDTLQANLGTTGNGSGEWTIGASTLGAANIPEPATASLAILGLAALARRRR